MTHHDWSDKDFDWNALYDAERIVHFWAWRIGRVGGQLKEKFGTLRYYCQFSDGTLQSLMYPGYARIVHPWFYWNIDVPIVQRIAKYTGLLYLIHKYQAFFYRLAYKKAVAKYPHIRDEILVDAGAQELVEGIAGYRHEDHWRTFGGSDEAQDS
jgi:hypothetical protein